MTGFPVGDWQFWAVTATAGWAVWVVVRPFVRTNGTADAACSQCGATTPGGCRSDHGPTEPPPVQIGGRRRTGSS